MTFSADFSSAKLPALTPLKNSFVVDEVENDLRNMFLDLFNTYLASDVFDLNVSGMAHLGTFDLVKKMINKDGLVLIPGDREESAARYIYRAWKSVNNQGRGLHFLRTYMQALYPGAWGIEQQMQESALAYPTALYDRSGHGDDTDKYLTSRINIKLDVASGIITDPSTIIPVISTIIPARFIPKILLILYAEERVLFGAYGNIFSKLTADSVITDTVFEFPNSNNMFYTQGNFAVKVTGSGVVH